MAAVLSPVGAVIGTEVFPATAAGYRELLQWARGLGTVRRAGAEGTSSFGAALSRYLLAQGVEVFDVNRPDRTDRRRRGKSDPLDAQNAARAVLSGRARARAKSGDGPVEIARMYKLAKVSAVKARTQAINQLKAVLVSADPNLREELALLHNAALFRSCAGLADDRKNDEDGEETVLRATRTTLCACLPSQSDSSPNRSGAHGLLVGGLLMIAQACQHLGSTFTGSRQSPGGPGPDHTGHPAFPGALLVRQASS
ncbi:IS110 family transposase [Streptomyces sp. NPDC001450]